MNTRDSGDHAHDYKDIYLMEDPTMSGDLDTCTN